MVFATIKTMADADPFGRACRDKANRAALAASCDLGHWCLPFTCPCFTAVDGELLSLRKDVFQALLFPCLWLLNF